MNVPDIALPVRPSDDGNSFSAMKRVASSPDGATRLTNAADIRFAEYAEHMHDHGFACVNTGGPHRRRTGERMVKRGLMTKVLAVVCDGDGYALDPEREREGFALTGPGRLALASARAKSEVPQAVFWVRGTLVRYAGMWQALHGVTWCDADNSQLRKIASHLDEHCASDGYPTDDADRALRHIDETPEDL